MEGEAFKKLLRENVREIYGLEGETGPETSTHIKCLSCKKPLVKPRTVLYGRNLPERFERNVAGDVGKAGLVLIAGTSLTVRPACGLVDYAKKDALRVVVDRGFVEGTLDFEQNENDGLVQGDVDSVVLEILDCAGWLKEMERYKGDMCESSRVLLEGRLEMTKG